jgi:hypothetical protein
MTKSAKSNLKRLAAMGATGFLNDKMGDHPAKGSLAKLIGFSDATGGLRVEITGDAGPGFEKGDTLLIDAEAFTAGPKPEAAAPAPEGPVTHFQKAHGDRPAVCGRQVNKPDTKTRNPRAVTCPRCAPIALREAAEAEAAGETIPDEAITPEATIDVAAVLLEWKAADSANLNRLLDLMSWPGAGPEIAIAHAMALTIRKAVLDATEKRGQ